MAVTDIIKKKKKGAALGKTEPYLYLAPAGIALLFMYAYPILSSFYIAVHEYNLKRLDRVYFTGLANFAKIFKDTDITMISRNTVIYVVICVSAQFLMGTALALALWRPFPGRAIYQGIVFFPWAMSTFVVGLIYRWSFNGEYGIVNDLLIKSGLLGSKLAFLGTPGLSLMVVIFAVIWMGVPFFGIMGLAALQSIPDDVMEAAEIDGCSAIGRFFNITLPYIKPTIITTILLRTIWVFNGVEMIVVVTEGGPANTSEILSSFLYKKAYSGFDFGFAAALGLMFIAGLLIYLAIYLKLTRFSEAGDF